MVNLIFKSGEEANFAQLVVVLGSFDDSPAATSEAGDWGHDCEEM